MSNSLARLELGSFCPVALLSLIGKSYPHLCPRSIFITIETIIIYGYLRPRWHYINCGDPEETNGSLLLASSGRSLAEVAVPVI